jgi:hypothetical protein
MILIALVLGNRLVSGQDNGPELRYPGSDDPAASKIVEEVVSGEISAQEDPSNNNFEPEPDPYLDPLVTIVDEIETDLTQNAPSAPNAVFFKRYAGSSFHPRDSTTTFNYGGFGCLYRTGGSTWFTIDVQVPDGAEIDFFRIYFYDNDADNNVIAYLYSFDGAGSADELDVAASSDTPGFSSAGSGFLSHIVDTTSESISLVVGFDEGNNSNLAFCGVRIRYQYAVASVTLPAVMNLMEP